MCIQPSLSVHGSSAAFSRNHKDALKQEIIQPRSPSGSIPESLCIKIEGTPLFLPSSNCIDSLTVGIFLDNMEEHETSFSPLQQDSARTTSHLKLPSIGEFDQGVEELARTLGPTTSWMPSSPPPPMFHNTPLLRTLQPGSSNRSSWSMGRRPSEDSALEWNSTRRGTITSLNQYALAVDQASQTLQGGRYMTPDSNMGRVSFHDHLGAESSFGRYSHDGYPTPPPDGEGRHINQKYLTEEGDFIIYAWHDKKMKWARIKQEYAAMFGKTPERTVQGLQAWYYRMNQKIPVWDSDGWLVFENEDDLEPQHVSIKCRERDSQDKPTEPLGLAQRYPERAMHYSWVDPEFKRRAQDWANKRELQYRERRERRARKEQRRLKL